MASAVASGWGRWTLGERQMCRHLGHMGLESSTRERRAMTSRLKSCSLHVDTVYPSRQWRVTVPQLLSCAVRIGPVLVQQWSSSLTVLYSLHTSCLQKQSDPSSPSTNWFSPFAPISVDINWGAEEEEKPRRLLKAIQSRRFSNAVSLSALLWAHRGGEGMCGPCVWFCISEKRNVQELIHELVSGAGMGVLSYSSSCSPHPSWHLAHSESPTE